MRRTLLRLLWIAIGLLFISPPAVMLWRERLKRSAVFEEHRWVLGQPPARVAEETTVDLFPASSVLGMVLPLPADVGELQLVVPSPDGRKILSFGASDRVLRLFSTQTGKELRSFGNTDVAAACFLPDGSRVVTTSWSVSVWDLNTGQGTPLTSADGFMRKIECVAVAPNGLTALSGSVDGSIHVWNLSNSKELGVITHTGRAARAVGYSADGNRVMAITYDGFIHVCDIRNGQQLASHRAYTGSVISAAFSANGRLVVLGCDNKTACLWDVDAMAQLHRLEGHQGAVNHASFSRNASKLLTRSNDELMLWDVASGRKLASRRVEGLGGLHKVALLPDGRHVVVGGSKPGVVAMMPAEKKE